MDVNGSRFHLLQGDGDWHRCRVGAQAPVFAAKKVDWNAERNEITLFREVLRFAGAKGERELTPGDRRGAARDQFENWYWIAPDRRSIFVRSSGSGNISTFWPAERAASSPVDHGGFRPVAPLPDATCELQGLAITEDHYLVAGVKRPGGLMIFDLYAGGAPKQRVWPVAFEPFALAARKNGGVWILDRTHKSVWQLDRRFDVLAAAELPHADDVGGFANVDGDPRDDIVARHPLPRTGLHIPARDPIGIADAPGGGALVLDSADVHNFARVFLIDGGAVRGTAASTKGMADTIKVVAGDPSFTLVAHDFALGARSANDPADWLARLYVAVVGGNQSFAFGVTRQGDTLHLIPMPKYFPMRLFSGRALVSAGGDPWYDSGDDWVKLLEQNRPRYEEVGELWTPVFDSGEPSCVWHRLMLDACIPPGASVDVYSRASDDWRELTLAEWLRPAEQRALGASGTAEPGAATSENDLADWQPEPSPYLRGGGSELPYLPPEAGPDRGTWELLFQRARGRYIQVKLVLRGDGRTTPRIRALRAWYPRFSYLERYLPAVYREDDQSASFLDRFLANVEGMFTGIEDRIAAAQILFDVASAPPETLQWLGQWLGVALDPSWEEHRRRLFIRHAMDFFAVRGTVRGLQLALRLALDDCVDDRLFDKSSAASRQAAPVRIIERFRARRTPRALLGDVGIAVAGPQRVDPSERWQPSMGVADLHRRYREALALPSGSEFPIVAADASDGWSDIAERTLGFVPRAGGAERGQWKAFLQQRYASIGALNAAHGTTWSSFDAIRLPTNEPTVAGYATDWSKFLATPSRKRRLWQDFLARRYRNVRALNDAWLTQWSGFSNISLRDRVPSDGARMKDWFQFEGTVLAMHAAAHQFTVMLPVPPNLRTDTPSQQRRLALATTVLNLEKPAHTTFDIRYYWAMFRVGEARLGDDTIIDHGSRSAALMSPMVLGQGYLAESFLAARPGFDAPARLQIGRDRVGRSTRIGGP